MYRRDGKNRGQSTLEYAFVVAVIVGALIAMQIYIKRSMEGKMKSTSDEIGEGYSAHSSKYVNTTNSESDSHETISPGDNKDDVAKSGVVETSASSMSKSKTTEHVLTFDKEHD